MSEGSVPRFDPLEQFVLGASDDVIDQMLVEYYRDQLKLDLDTVAANVARAWAIIRAARKKGESRGAKVVSQTRGVRYEPKRP